MDEPKVIGVKLASLEDDDVRTTYIQIRVSPDEKAAIKIAARKAHMKVSEWIRTVAMKSPEV